MTVQQDLTTLYDTIIVGGGPAGLSAGLVLGRCRRRVLLCDAGQPRNTVTHAMHGFLSRDGIDPAEFRRICRDQLNTYNVEIRDIEVAAARRDDGRFEVTLSNGARCYARTLLLATGIVDVLPEIDGFEERYGHSVFQCPYCDAWEVRDVPMVVYSRGPKALAFALLLKIWSDDIVLCTNGPCGLDPQEREQLEHHRIPVYEAPILRLEGPDRQLERVVLEGDQVLERRAMFFALGQEQRSPLAASLECEINEEKGVVCNDLAGTSIPGVFVAGDASRDVQLVIVAAAEGTKAAFAINRQLHREDHGLE